LKIRYPSPRDDSAATGAQARCGEPVFEDVKAAAFDEERVAVGAIGVLELPSSAGQVSGIDEAQTRSLADPGCPD
jgi:hypothetical protein